jgi:hypothetical protein
MTQFKITYTQRRNGENPQIAESFQEQQEYQFRADSKTQAYTLAKAWVSESH